MEVFTSTLKWEVSITQANGIKRLLPSPFDWLVNLLTAMFLVKNTNVRS